VSSPRPNSPNNQLLPIGITALVTGAARGNGLAIARALAAHGAAVGLADLDEATLDEAVAAMRGAGHIVSSAVMDVRDGEAVDAGVTAIAQELGGIDVLVNNAGIFENAHFGELDERAWVRTIDINLNGYWRVAHAVRPYMTDNGRACVVNVSSVAACMVPGQGLAAYCTSKAGIEGLTRAMAMDLGGEGIRVNAVSPGVILTDMTRHLYSTEQARIAATRRIPLERIGSPDEVADVVLFLVSPMSRYVTGSVVPVDGGFLLGASPLG
jgi:NAD(P)-dependent dehydrogenase (short-subunit alcohol dehydrogenase family)